MEPGQTNEAVIGYSATPVFGRSGKIFVDAASGGGGKTSVLNYPSSSGGSSYSSGTSSGNKEPLLPSFLTLMQPSAPTVSAPPVSLLPTIELDICHNGQPGKLLTYGVII